MWERDSILSWALYDLTCIYATPNSCAILDGIKKGKNMHALLCVQGALGDCYLLRQENMDTLLGLTKR